jgi:hypothetical protein
MSFIKKCFNFFLVIGVIYTALFLIASQNYENGLNEVQHNANRVFYFLNTPGAKQTFERIPKIQNMQGPVRPVLGSIPSLIDSLSGKQTPFPVIGAQLKTIVEVYKSSLEEPDSGARI